MRGLSCAPRTSGTLRPMGLWRSLDDIDPQLGPSVVTIGVFDGVHRGHRSVLSYAVECSRHDDTELPVVAVTFDPHPVAVLAPSRTPALLTRIERRAELLAGAGARHVLALPFDRRMADWSPEEFVQRVLVDALHARAVVVGENFRFGHRAAGDVGTLARLGAEHGFSLHALTLSGVDDHVWSSTLVRRHLGDGDVEAAAGALGRLFTIEGVVVRGDQRGRQLGYPTANVPTPAGIAVPADGVYAGWLRRLDDPAAQPLPAAISVGTNPTFDGIEHRVESYVLDRDDLELYDVPVEVSFVRRLRGQVRFDSVDALVEQMDADCDAARTLLTGDG